MVSNNDNENRNPHESDQINQAQESASDSENQPSKLETELIACSKELQEWKDRCLRTAAEYENFKKRAEKEKGILIQHAQGQILRNLIDIVDDFDRAFASLAGKEDENTKLWLSGFTFIYQALNKLLANYGVQEMKEYKTFDPMYHEALMQVESPEHKSGDIVQVLAKGYLFKGHVLRPAKVSVAK